MTKPTSSLSTKNSFFFITKKDWNDQKVTQKKKKKNLQFKCMFEKKYHFIKFLPWRIIPTQNPFPNTQNNTIKLTKKNWQKTCPDIKTNMRNLYYSVNLPLTLALATLPGIPCFHFLSLKYTKNTHSLSLSHYVFGFGYGSGFPLRNRTLFRL